MDNRDFKGIWIPKDIWLSDKLTLQEKIMYIEIDSLDNEHGCFATNKYFADFFSLSEDRVSKIIQSLVKKGHVSVDINRQNGNTRTLHTLSVETQIPISGNADPYIRYITYINLNELFDENETSLYKNEIAILSIMIKLGYKLSTKQEVLDCVARVKTMMSRYVGRREDGRLDWSRAIQETEDWYVYWKNPPKGKKPPTNFQSSLTNRMKPKDWKNK